MKFTINTLSKLRNGTSYEKMMFRFVLVFVMGLTYYLYAGYKNIGASFCKYLVQNELVIEASGIAASRAHSNVLWIHNDSGDMSRIFAIDSTGKNLGVFDVNGIVAYDWEDIAVGPGPVPEKQYLYIGDIGDNKLSREVKFIHRIVEPEVASGQLPVFKWLDCAETMAFRYPDGNHDAETLMIDPLTRDIYIATKDADGCGIYRAAFPQSTHEVVTLEFIMKIRLKMKNGFRQVVAGDISPSGSRILLKTYGNIYCWARTNIQTVKEALETKPIELPYVIEPKGEALTWSSNGESYFTISEERHSVPAYLYHYSIKLPAVESGLAELQLASR